VTATPPRAASGADFDPARLQACLTARLPGLAGEMQLERIGGGQSNPTYFLSFDNRRLVLRKQPGGDLLPGAHDVAREYRAMAALVDTPVPVPTPVLLETDRGVIGTAFYLMERVDGRIFYDHRLPDLPREHRRDLYFSMADTLAELHAVDWRATDLAGLARPGSFLERQVERWAMPWTGEVGEVRSQGVAVADWLRADRPTPERAALIHGDLKLSNAICHPIRPAIVAVLDWELFAIGEPMLDLAHTIASIWSTGPDEYGGVMGCDLAALGVPTEAEFLARYYAAAKSPARMTRFHQVLALLRAAGIFHGIGQRAKAGVAAAAGAAETARLAEVYLQRAHALITTT
jgi:aminoglycoside phosphotransferase (APT) family kinase protein